MTTTSSTPPTETCGAGGSHAWTLELPFTRPLSLNQRANHWAKAAEVRTWRQATAWLARQQRIPPLGRISAQLLYTPADDRRRDPLNLVASLKAIEDGLVDAKVIVDDSSRYHTSVMPVITGKGPARRGGNRLWVVVTQL